MCIFSALNNNTPVIVGVDVLPGSPNPNTDNITDHFVTIVGMGRDGNGIYFRFFDNASGHVGQGANLGNKFYWNESTGKLSGQSQTPYGLNNGIFTVTQIRKSKK